jgi:beta-glucanase (GH16 family)
MASGVDRRNRRGPTRPPCLSKDESHPPAQEIAVNKIVFAASSWMVVQSMSLADPPSSRPATQPASRPGWELVWQDEFDAPGLPDSKKWVYEQGFVRNNEAQYYTKARQENCRVENGMLVIEARKEKFRNARYTSASIHTLGKASWTCGRIEMRAKLPQGKGVWPAFWTLGDDIKKVGWPACGEIDIMEFVGHTPDRVHGTLHWKQGGHRSKGGNLTVSQPWADFHVYAVEWSPEKIDFFFDETQYLSVPLSTADAGARNAFNKPHHVKLNLALGGGWGGKIDDSIFPQKFVVDYVRVYQREEAAPETRPAADAFQIRGGNGDDRAAIPAK